MLETVIKDCMKMNLNDYRIYNTSAISLLLR